ncbi:MAG: FAD-dependent monooxygenase [Cyclobacteriaceae bacterium]
MKDKIIIVGAGLVGSLLALLLRQKGFQVVVYEKRKDPRRAEVAEGRSINLALSHRGIRPIKMAGIFDRIEPSLIPMKGRMMHDTGGNLTYQPYGKEGQHINSVSRAILNETLIQASEEAGVEFIFDHKCESIDFEKSTILFSNGTEATGDLIIGSDGAFSAIRQQFQFSDRFNYAQHYIEHGYKELTMEPIDGNFGLEPNYLHIWPRGNFMLIALPNRDKTFTCTLFFPFEGDPSFESLKTRDEVSAFFKTWFKDALELIPNLIDQFFINPASSLVTVLSEPWNRGRTLLIGDAAHAIVPFYGQGMNSGFEDVRIFVEMAEKMKFNWDEVLPVYAKERKKDADAISELALYNFIEMRDHVANQDFLNRKKLEAELQKKYPDDWIPLYSMVTFSDIPYSEALRIGKIQTRVLEDYLSNPSDIDYGEIMEKFNSLKKAGPTGSQ